MRLPLLARWSVFSTSSWTSLILAASLATPGLLQAGFVNFETAPVHPVAISPDQRTLAVCNLPDSRIELFDLGSGRPVPSGSVTVGVDPVSLRFRTADELWVANYVSRTVNIVDVRRGLIVETLETPDGPADIVFAGQPGRAFVSCARENTVRVFDAVTRQIITNLVLDGEQPKAMAVSPDGSKVYVAIFESGNASTILTGTAPETDRLLKHPDGPYGGQFPVPNDGRSIRPAINPILTGLEWQFPDSLIVKKDAQGRWMDDNYGDWTDFVSGSRAPLSGRILGWDLPDRDVAVIDSANFGVSYLTGLMNICMGLAVNPASGRITVVGTDGLNERRFEPNLRGTFLRVNLAWVDPASSSRDVVDLNPHLDYSTGNIPPETRALSLGDPRGIVWNEAGTRGYVTGMGSGNLVAIDADGHRIGATPIELGEGPTGLALDEARQRLYVLNRFSATISVLDLPALNTLTNIPIYDPTPAVIRTGRKHFYDTRLNSGLGHASCASCHVDGRVDRLAWDLGDPRSNFTSAPGSGIPFHPMKGPMVTLTLQDIIVPPQFTPSMPLHWRGDRLGLEDFNLTFTDLLGADAQLTAEEMQEFKAFLATIYFPPNRYRTFDNSAPTNQPLPGFYGVDSQGVVDRTPLPNGNAVEGGRLFLDGRFDGRFPLTMGRCATCHNHASGRGSERDFLQVGREGDRPFRPGQLRSLGEKLGFDLQGTNSRAGFGLRFDGRADTIPRLLVDVFQVDDNQTLADLTAFLLAFPGPGDELASQRDDSQDSHAAVGKQFSVKSGAGHPLLPKLMQMAGEKYSAGVDLIVRGVQDGLVRGWIYVDGYFESDRNNESLLLPELLALATPDLPLTFTSVTAGTGRRLAVDRDEDGFYDRTEMEQGFDPANSSSHPTNMPPVFDLLPDSFHLLHPGMTLQARFSAVDLDVPSQTLRFSLDPGAPSGARIDSISGLFEWTPTLEQGDGYYHLRVRVFDDGAVPLSIATSLDILVVTLRLVDFYWEESGAAVLVCGSRDGRTIPGQSYQLQYKDRLDSAAWQDLGEPLFAGGGSVLFRDETAPAGAQRFYRVTLAR